MKFKELKEKYKQGRLEAIAARLDTAEAWTPLLTYVHVTHFVAGVIGGFLLGVAITVPTMILIFKL